MEVSHMSNKPVKGLKVGNYRITPLGLIVLAVLLALIIGAVVLVVVRPFDKNGDVATNNVLPPEEEVPVEEEVEVTHAHPRAGAAFSNDPLPGRDRHAAEPVARGSEWKHL